MPWRTATSTPRPATALHRPSCLDRAVSSPRAGLPGRRRRGRLHRALLLLEAKHLPVYYFPAQDVRTELLEPSDTRTHFPYKGDACYWSVRVGKRVARDAVWSYQDPLAERTDIKGYLAVYWTRMDAWFEEDDEVSSTPRPVSPGGRAQQLLARGPRGAGARPARAAARRWPPCGLGGAAGRTALGGPGCERRSTSATRAGGCRFRQPPRAAA